MKIDIHLKRFTSAEVTAAAGCSEAALRQWRNRYRFLDGTVPGDMKVKKFSLLDTCVVRGVKVLTDCGVTAPDAIWIAHHPMGLGALLRSRLNKMDAAPTLLAITPGDRAKGEKFNFSPIGPHQLAATMADSVGIMFVFDLNAINQHVLDFLKEDKE